MTCFLAEHGIHEHGTMPPCSGRLVRAHLLSRQLLRRELDARTARDAIDNPASFVLACGGPLGNSGHHGAFDTARTIRVPYDALPAQLIALADQLGLAWWLAREYREPVRDMYDALPNAMAVELRRQNKERLARLDATTRERRERLRQAAP